MMFFAEAVPVLTMFWALEVTEHLPEKVRVEKKMIPESMFKVTMMKYEQNHKKSKNKLL